MAVASQQALPPGASLEGVGQGAKKKIINKIYEFILIFTSSQLLLVPKQ
jgi:hypothetical protein